MNSIYKVEWYSEKSEEAVLETMSETVSSFSILSFRQARFYDQIHLSAFLIVSDWTGIVMKIMALSQWLLFRYL